RTTPPPTCTRSAPTRRHGGSARTPSPERGASSATPTPSPGVPPTTSPPSGERWGKIRTSNGLAWAKAPNDSTTHAPASVTSRLLGLARNGVHATRRLVGRCCARLGDRGL